MYINVFDCCICCTLQFGRKEKQDMTLRATCARVSAHVRDATILITMITMMMIMMDNECALVHIVAKTAHDFKSFMSSASRPTGFRSSSFATSAAVFPDAFLAPAFAPASMSALTESSLP